MSEIVTLRTAEKIKPKNLFNELANQGIHVVVVADEFPTIVFGETWRSLRGIEVTETEDSYEVRCCAFSSKADYELFIRTVTILSGKLSAGIGNEDGEVLTLKEFQKSFDNSWIKERCSTNESLLNVISAQNNSILKFEGLFFPVVYGATFDKHMSDRHKHPLDELCDIQWTFKNTYSTRSHLSVKDNNDNGHSVSLLIYPDCTEAKEGLLIEDADLFAAYNSETEEFRLIPFEYVSKIIRGRRIDERQVFVSHPIDKQEFDDIFHAASLYEPEDIFQKAVMPGNGAPDRQRTFILMWNPDISSVKMKDWQELIPEMYTMDFNWSIREHENAHINDRFYLITCGYEGRKGIVGSGVFKSNPYEGEDWRGTYRKVYYCDVKFNVMLDPEAVDIITADKIKLLMPDFNWDGGSSGRLLNPDYTEILDSLWSSHIDKWEAETDRVHINTDSRLSGNQ